MERNRAYYRHHRKRAIRRKCHIAVHKLGGTWWKEPRIIGQFAKGKVHCSCGMCTAKTKIYGYKMSEKKRLIDMNQQEQEVELVGYVNYA